MSVHGEFRRILGDVVAALRADGAARLADELEPLRERATDDLSAAAEETLAILPRIEDQAPSAGADPDVSDAAERLESVCCIILGRA